jgi:hypothetical protein
MNSQKAEELLAKYWEGATTEDEERQLKQYFESKGAHPAAGYFKYLAHKSNERPLDKEFDADVLDMITERAKGVRGFTRFAFSYWYAAAAVAALLTLGVLLRSEIKWRQSDTVMVQEDTFEDPAKALEETKKALLYISSRLNQSNDYASRLSKFEQGQQIVEQN